ncbi:MAG: hypothetical protein LBJ14_09325 [Desulfarculales bacterium]|jgi:hypothetical protein|nr:hypothetical protein [Desulfarculales bacterium]
MGKTERIIVIFLLAVLLSWPWEAFTCRAGEEQPPRQTEEEPPPLNLDDLLPSSQDPPPEPMRRYTITDRPPQARQAQQTPERMGVARPPAQGRIEANKPSEQAQVQTNVLFRGDSLFRRADRGYPDPNYNNKVTFYRPVTLRRQKPEGEN